MADKVQYVMDKLASVFIKLKELSLFNDSEVHLLSKRITDFEYILQRRQLQVSDFCNYLQYYIQLDKLRDIRSKKNGLELAQERIADLRNIQRSFLRHISYIFERAIRRFPKELSLWNDYISFLSSNNCNKILNSVYGRILSLFPKNEDIWIAASSHELTRNNNAHASRILMQRSLRVNKSSEKLWLNYYQIELWYALRIIQRKKVLGLETSSDISKDPSGSSESLFAAPLIVFRYGMDAINTVEFAMEIHKLSPANLKEKLEMEIIKRYGSTSAALWCYLCEHRLQGISSRDLVIPQDLASHSQPSKKKRKRIDLGRENNRMLMARVVTLLTSCCRTVYEGVRMMLGLGVLHPADMTEKPTYDGMESIEKDAAAAFVSAIRRCLEMALQLVKGKESVTLNSEDRGTSELDEALLLVVQTLDFLWPASSSFSAGSGFGHVLLTAHLAWWLAVALGSTRCLSMKLHGRLADSGGVKRWMERTGSCLLQRYGVTNREMVPTDDYWAPSDGELEESAESASAPGAALRDMRAFHSAAKEWVDVGTRLLEMTETSYRQVENEYAKAIDESSNIESNTESPEVNETRHRTRKRTTTDTKEGGREVGLSEDSALSLRVVSGANVLKDVIVTLLVHAQIAACTESGQRLILRAADVLQGLRTAAEAIFNGTSVDFHCPIDIVDAIQSAVSSELCPIEMRVSWCLQYLHISMACTRPISKPGDALKNGLLWLKQLHDSSPHLFVDANMTPLFDFVVPMLLNEAKATIAGSSWTLKSPSINSIKILVSFITKILSWAVSVSPSEVSFWDALEEFQRLIGDQVAANHTRWRRNRTIGEVVA